MFSFVVPSFVFRNFLGFFLCVRFVFKALAFKRCVRSELMKMLVRSFVEHAIWRFPRDGCVRLGDSDRVRECCALHVPRVSRSHVCVCV